MPVSQKFAPGRLDGRPWWAVYTRHQHEKAVAGVLLTKGLEVFLPLYSSMHRWKDRSKMLSLPLFPCYVFTRGELNCWLKVVTTPGVHMILRNAEGAALIPDQEVQAIRKTVNETHRFKPHPFLTCGERVRVTRGCLEGVEGLLIRQKGQYRLVLSVAMLAQSVAVEVDSADVEPLGMQNLTAAFLTASYEGSKGFQSILQPAGN